MSNSLFYFTVKLRKGKVLVRKGFVLFGEVGLLWEDFFGKF
jgi:hypothetical protein